MPPASAAYVMGHNDHERRRLALQGAILNPITEGFLRRAGIGRGMHVLDMGSGIGELALMAGRLVGRRGRVTALDIDAAALAIVERRARERGATNISVAHGEIGAYRPERPFDAVIGRHILIHTPDPAGVLRIARGVLTDGGVAAFQEFDFTAAQPAFPPWPLRDRIARLFQAFFTAATHGGIGSMLFYLFVQAGFEKPDCRAEYPIDGGADSPFYEWLAESVRTVRPRAEALGLCPDPDLDPDALPDRLRAEAASLQASWPAPVMVGAFARKRHAS